MGVKNLRQFNLGLDKFAKTVETQSVLFVKKMAFLVLGAYVQLPGGAIRAVVGLLQLTPVDTGRAVGNYQVTIGTPATGEIPITFGVGGGSGELERKKAEAFATTGAARALAQLQLGQSVFITNNLPYILVLNDGAENRVAHHMLERAVDNARRSVRAA